MKAKEINWKRSLELGNLDLFVYYRKGADEDHTGLVVAHNKEEARQTILFPETVKEIFHISEVVDTFYANSTELK